MPSPFGPMRVVLNPRAGRNAVEHGWPEARAVLDELGLEHTVAVSEGPGHAITLAREAIEAGIRFVVAVGGDGTINEVVNGMMGDEGPLDPDAVLGVIGAGSGSDFLRTFGLSDDPAEAARHLDGKTLWGKLDIGRIRYTGLDGEPARRWFCNIAEAGIGAHVVAAAARMPRALGGRAYRLAALRGVLSYKPQEVRVSMVGRRARGTRVDAPLTEIEHAARATMVVVANCQFFGGGLRVAPRAIPSDGRLDVLVGEGSKWDAIKALQKMPLGLHVPDPAIAEFLAERVELDGAEPMLIEADGELLGASPAVFDCVRAAIPLKV